MEKPTEGKDIPKEITLDKIISNEYKFNMTPSTVQGSKNGEVEEKLDEEDISALKTFVEKTPDEILVVIATFVCYSPMDTKKLALVCKNWNTIVSQDIIWSHLYDIHFQRKRLLLSKISASPYDEQSTWKEWFKERYEARKKGTWFKNCKVNEGSFKMVGKTVNGTDWKGNITPAHGGIVTLSGKKLTGSMMYGNGTDYNTPASATWSGIVENGVISWKEKFGKHNGFFIYDGKIVSDVKMVGDYRWDQNQAKGKFEFIVQID